MFDKLKKHSVKIFVFTINILLAAIAVLIIREKDQARLLENAQKENIANENAGSSTLPSFEGSVEDNSVQIDVPSQPSPVDSSTVVPENTAPEISVPTNPVPVPVQNIAPANTKTKTS
jgi:hypothetical protein